MGVRHTPRPAPDVAYATVYVGAFGVQGAPHLTNGVLVNPLNTVTDAVTLPARTAGHVAAATLGATVGAATVGLRATGRALGRALDRGVVG